MSVYGQQSGGAFLPNQAADVRAWAVTQPVTTLSVNGAIPVLSGAYRIINVAAGAYTLRAPTVDEEGTTLFITAGTAAAHAITATGLIQNGIVGGAKSSATTAAFIGSSITLVALNLNWFVQSSVAITFA
jgi:hypothetical protein